VGIWPPCPPKNNYRKIETGVGVRILIKELLSIPKYGKYNITRTFLIEAVQK
jgi:hypothetical protein